MAKVPIAPGVSVKWDFDDKKTAAAFQRASDAPVKKFAGIVEREAKVSMKTGGRSTGPRGGKVQTPSAPGTPPHVQTGVGRGSIGYGKVKPGTWIVGPDRKAWYMRLHEQPERPLSPGSKTSYKGRTFAQRAFMRPALIRSQKDFPKEFKAMKAANTPEGRSLNSKRGNR